MSAVRMGWLARCSPVACVAIGALAIACDDGPFEPTITLPTQMRLEATAVGRVNGLDVDCLMDMTVNVQREVRDDGTVYTGSFGGEVRRSVLDASQAGLVFWAQAHSDVHIVEGALGQVELVSYRDGVPIPRVTDSRFWEEVRVFRGRRGSGDVLLEGEWTCQPMDVRGDDVAAVRGTWRLTETFPAP